MAKSDEIAKAAGSAAAGAAAGAGVVAASGFTAIGAIGEVLVWVLLLAPLV